MQTIPSRKNEAPGDERAAGRPFRVGDIVDAPKQQTQATEDPAPPLIAIRFPKPGDVITYAAAEIEEGTHCFKLFTVSTLVDNGPNQIAGKERGQLVAIYNKHTGAIIESVDPVAVEVSEPKNELVYVDDGRPGSVGYWKHRNATSSQTEPKRGFWSRLFGK